MEKMQPYVIEEGWYTALNINLFLSRFKTSDCLEAIPDVIMAVIFVYLNTMMSEKRDFLCSFIVAVSDWISYNQFL